LKFLVFFKNISWPHVNQLKIYNTSWNSKNKEARRGWACSKEKKTFRPLYFQISYLPHILFVLNNLKNYGNTIWSFTKKNSSAKTIKWCPKILSTIMQNGHMCQPTCPCPASFRKNIFCSFLHRFEWFLLHWMCHLKFYKKIGSAKEIKWCPKILSSRIQIGHICANHIMPMTPSFGKAYLTHSFIGLSDFFCIRCAIWSFTKISRSEKTIEWHSKMLSSRIQTNHMCQPHHAHDPFHLEKAYLAYSFIDLNNFFCIACAIYNFTKPFEVQRQ